jgi:hypothetical protein
MEAKVNIHRRHRSAILRCNALSLERVYVDYLCRSQHVKNGNLSGRTLFHSVRGAYGRQGEAYRLINPRRPTSFSDIENKLSTETCWSLHQNAVDKVRTKPLPGQ